MSLNIEELGQETVQKSQTFLEDREAVYKLRKEQIAKVCAKYRNVTTNHSFLTSTNTIGKNAFKADRDHRLAMCENAKVRNA